MSELLFETYGAPAISYGIDALFSYRQNVRSQTSTGLVVSSGNYATHVIPVIHGKSILSQAKRLQWGGTQAVEFMLKLLQLKYPSFPSKLTFLQAQTLVWDHCYVAPDYHAELRYISDKAHLRELDRTIQFPYTEFVFPAIYSLTCSSLPLKQKKKSYGH
jgi:actin-related protein 5